MCEQEWRGEKTFVSDPGRELMSPVGFCGAVPSCRDEPRYVAVEASVLQQALPSACSVWALLLLSSQDKGEKWPSSWRMLWMLLLNVARLQLNCKSNVLCAVWGVKALGSYHRINWEGKRNPGLPESVFLVRAVLERSARALRFEGIQ